MSQLPQQIETNKSLIAYSVGFISSIVLTLTAYLLVTNDIMSPWMTAIVIVGLALVQCLVQLVFFLHLGQERRPRWRLLSMLAMLAIFCVIVFGSIWVMYNLNDRMMPTDEQMVEYMDKQTGF